MPRIDPRLQDATEGVPEEIRNASIRHALYLERLKTSEADRIKAQLERALSDVLDRITARLARINARGFDAGPATTRRLQEMAHSIADILDPAYDRMRDTQVESLLEIAQAELVWQQGTINKAVGISMNFVTPNIDLMREVVLRRPFQGQLLREWYQGLAEGTKGRLREAVRLGITEGETTDQIVRRIRGTRAAGYADGVMEISRRGAESVVRTAVNHVSSSVRSELFKANSSVVKAVQWIATLDGRTTPICQSRDGKTYPVDAGPRPPAHRGCRSTVAPVLKSWRELGIDAAEMPESMRASMNGQVPESMRYGDWLRSRANAGDTEIVEEALGKTRAKLFMDGKLSVDRFVDQRGRQLTLAELKRRERSAFEAAGVNVE